MAEKEKKSKKKCTYIGGQAVLEGVMMMGKTAIDRKSTRLNSSHM